MAVHNRDHVILRESGVVPSIILPFLLYTRAAGALFFGRISVRCNYVCISGCVAGPLLSATGRSALV